MGDAGAASFESSSPAVVWSGFTVQRYFSPRMVFPRLWLNDCAVVRRCRARHTFICGRWSYFALPGSRKSEAAIGAEFCRKEARSSRSWIVSPAENFPTLSTSLNAGVEEVSPCRRLFITQPGLEPITEEIARDRRERRFWKVTKSRRLHRTATAIAVTARDVATGAERTLRCQYFVRADGAHSKGA